MPVLVEVALLITIDAGDRRGDIELVAKGTKNYVQVGLEVGKCSLVDLKGMCTFKDCYCWQYLGVHLGRHRADTDFNKVLGCKPRDLYGQRKVKVQHNFTGSAVQ
jgi:hypothetical protein